MLKDSPTYFLNESFFSCVRIVIAMSVCVQIRAIFWCFAFVLSSLRLNANLTVDRIDGW